MKDIKLLGILFWLLNIYDIFGIADSSTFGILSMNFYLTQYNVSNETAGKFV